MADNIEVTPGSGATVATDLISSVHHVYSAMEWGVDGTKTPVGTGVAALPIQDGGNSITVDNGDFVDQGSASSGQRGPLTMGKVASTLVLTTGRSYPLTMNNNGALRVVQSNEELEVLSVLSSTVGNTATNVSSGQAKLFSIQASNTSGANKFLKIYNTAATPTPGAGTPVIRLVIPAGFSGTLFASGIGVIFDTGIGFTLTGGVNDNDTTALANNDVVVNITTSSF